MGANARIAARYLIGFLMAKQVIPDSWGDQFLNDPEAMAALQSGIVVGAAFVTEMFRSFAKKRGWTL